MNVDFPNTENHSGNNSILYQNKKELLLSDYSSLETKKLHAAAQIAQEGAIKEIEDYLSSFAFPFADPAEKSCTIINENENEIGGGAGGGAVGGGA